MPQFLQSIVQQDVTLSASSVTDLIDLPVNPISHILLTIKARNDTPTLSNYRLLTVFTSFVTNIEVLFKGQAVIEGTLADLMVMNALLTGYQPGLYNTLNTDDNLRAATFMLSFSRVPFWTEEAFPATSRGEFQIRITTGANPTGADFFQLQLETVELLNVTPRRFCKYTTYVGTSFSTGDQDRDLPRGNPILGTLLFGAGVQTTTGGVNTVETVKLLVDNVEQYYPLVNWEGLHGQMMRRMTGNGVLQSHFHNVLSTGGVALDTDQQEYTQELLNNYAYLDFDPLKDGEFALQTEGRGRVALRLNFGDTGVMRFLPVELMSVAVAS